MKRFWVLIIVPILTAYLLAGCGGEINVYYDPEQAISVKINQEFIIAARSNPTAGYLWRETYDKNILELTASTFETSEAVKRGEAEIGLEQHFRFKALKKGKTQINIDLGAAPKLSVKRRIFSIDIR